jgi:hypothetical protein
MPLSLSGCNISESGQSVVKPDSPSTVSTSNTTPFRDNTLGPLMWQLLKFV